VQSIGSNTWPLIKPVARPGVFFRGQMEKQSVSSILLKTLKVTRYRRLIVQSFSFFNFILVF